MEPNVPIPPIPTKRLPSWLITITPLSKLIALILFIAFPFLGFYLGISYQKRLTINETGQSSIQTKSVNETINSESESITPPNSTDFLQIYNSRSQLFAKRNVGWNGNFVGEVDYPSEVKNISENQLIGMNCTVIEQKVPFEQKAIEAKTIDTYFALSAYKILSKYQAQQSGTKAVYAITSCLLEDSRILFAMFVEEEPGKVGTTLFGLLDNDKLKIGPSTSVDFSSGGSPRLSLDPIQFTNENIFYYSQSVGDGADVDNLYKIDFDANTHKKIFSCTTHSDYVEVYGTASRCSSE